MRRTFFARSVLPGNTVTGSHDRAVQLCALATYAIHHNLYHWRHTQAGADTQIPTLAVCSLHRHNVTQVSHWQ